MKYKTAICAIMKDNEKYLIEWIEYHLMIGVEHFYITNNESTDNTEKILQYYQKIGVVDYVNMKGNAIQTQSYDNFLPKLKIECEWVAIIDDDEFIQLSNYSNLNDYLSNFYNTYPNHTKWKHNIQIGGIIMNWKIFGTSFHKNPTTGLIIKDYLYRGKNNMLENVHFKSIIRPSVVDHIMNHESYYYESYLAFNENYTPIITGTPFFQSAQYQDIWVNHYSSRSENELRFKYEKKGWPDSPIPEKHYIADLLRPKGWIESRLHDANTLWNEVYDDSMLKYVPELEKRVKYRIEELNKNDNN